MSEHEQMTAGREHGQPRPSRTPGPAQDLAAGGAGLASGTERADLTAMQARAGGAAVTGHLAALQRSAGNGVVASLLGRPTVPTIQREGDGAPRPPAAASPSYKYTWTFGERELGKAGLGEYAELLAKVGGRVEVEVSRESGADSAEPDGKTTSGASLGDDGLKYQSEVEWEWQRRTEGLFAGLTPKAKVGGEVGQGGGSVGVAFSLEGKYTEVEFGFKPLELDPHIQWATLEAVNSFRSGDWKVDAGQGVTLTITPWIDVKFELEPNTAGILKAMAERIAMEGAAELLIAGSIVVTGLLAVVGTLVTIGQGDDYAEAIDAAARGRDRYVDAFVAAACGEEPPAKDKYAAAGREHGLQWRTDLATGKGPTGTALPSPVVDARGRQNRAQLQSQATTSANQVLHQELVRRYWEIHNWQRAISIGQRIDDTYAHLMEEMGFLLPDPKEGL